MLSLFAKTERGGFYLQRGFGFGGNHVPGDVVDCAIEGIQQIQTGSGVPGFYQAIRFHHPTSISSARVWMPISANHCDEVGPRFSKSARVWSLFICIRQFLKIGNEGQKFNL